MNTIYPPGIPVSSIVQQSKSMNEFKAGVDELIARRSYFISKVLPSLIEGQDFHIIKGRKSLSKGGSEKVASIYGFTASFEQDNETMKAFENVKGIIAFICNLNKGGVKIGQGRGASTLTKNDNDPNKTIKMAQKSAYIDSVIRSSGLSDIFTQDLETMPISVITKIPDKKEYIELETEIEEEPPMTQKQNVFLRQLIFNQSNPRTRENLLSQLESGLNRFDASELISSLLPM